MCVCASASGEREIFSTVCETDGCVWMCVFQAEKEVLSTETGELRQKVRYLQDQLLPLSKQREYQEKEIQRLNRVRALPPPPHPVCV